MRPRFPFPFPLGWFQVAYSDELAAGQVEAREYFGRQLVLYRTDSGEPKVHDAFCPHLGAHLGHGGKVIGESIQCPFHGWRFNGDGSCVEVPYAQKIPPKACLKTYPVVERNGMIMMWYHPHDAAPWYEIPVVPEAGSDEWTPFEKRRWKLRTCNQEMAENGADTAHFFYVHGSLNQANTGAEIDGPWLRLKHEMRMGTPQGDALGVISADALGFGFSRIRFEGIVETLLLTSVTPIEGEHVDVRFAFSVKKVGDADASRGVGAALIRDIEKQIGEDREVWENKIYQPRPVLCDGDGPIGVFRKWCKQFYVEGDVPAGAAVS